MPLQTKVTKIINLAARMNTRSNNEVLDVDANQTGLELYNLQNGDLFYTKSLTSREGLTDICGGVIGASGSASIIYPYPSGSIPGSVSTSGTFNVPVYIANLFWDREGDIIELGDSVQPSGTNPASPFNLNGAKFLLRDNSASGTSVEGNYDLTVQFYLSAINNNGVFSGNSIFQDPFGVSHTLVASGLNATSTAPQLANAPSTVASIGSIVDAVPVAITDPLTINFGGVYASGSPTWSTPWLEIPCNFSAPFPIENDSIYYLKMVVFNTSGTDTRQLETQVTYSDVNTTINDVGLNNVMYANEYLNFPTNSLLRPVEGVYPVGGVTGWLTGDIYEHQPATYTLMEYPAVKTTMTAPLGGELLYGGGNFNYGVYEIPTPNTNRPYPGLTQTPPFDTDSLEFGNIMTLPSGTHSIDGTYFYANLSSGTAGTINDNQIWTRNKSIPPLTNYNLGYVANFSEITNSASPYTTQLLATYTGNYVFSAPNTYNDTVNDNILAGINVDLEKIYALFPNPPVVTTDGTKKYLVSWKFIDFNSGGAFSDFTTRNIFGTLPSGGSGWLWKFASPIGLGTCTPSGTDVMVQTNPYQYSGTFTPWAYQNTRLSCGILSFPSGNAITSIYDYRVGDSRTQEVIFTQGDKVHAFKDFDPANTIITLYSGAAVGDNYKWSHSTFQSMLFSHQYSQTSGICWDQIYYDPSGNSMEPHGKRPVVEFSGATLPILPSGAVGVNPNEDFNIILATTMNSGGFRSSEIYTYSGANASGAYLSTGNAMQLFGSLSGSSNYPYDIQFSGTNDGTYQYNFDVNSLGTFVFTSQPSGAVYYLAALCDSSGIAISNPRPNDNTWNLRYPPASGMGTGVYLFDIQYSGVNSIQVPNAINYDQTYLINQVDVPKFKKTIVYKNTLYGIGDINNPSRLWYSEIQAPQVFGVDTNFYGYYDIDNDNGQELTGIEIFKDYLLIFKENSMYRASFTANPGNPLEIFQVSNVKGCLGIFTTVATDYGIIGLNQYGPFLASYAGIENIGDEILPYFQTLDREELIYSVAIHDPARQQIYWSISSANESPDNQTGLVYSYAEKAWGIRQNGMWNAAGRIGDLDNFSKYYIGDTIGQIKQLNSGDYDQDILFVDTNNISLTKNITLQFETPWLNFDNSQNLKQLKFVKINCENSNQKLRVDVYTDQNPTKRYTRYLNMNVPVINRVCSLSGLCRTVKLVITSVGLPDQVKINSLQFGFIDMGMSTNIM